MGGRADSEGRSFPTLLGACVLLFLQPAHPPLPLAHPFTQVPRARPRRVWAMPGPRQRRARAQRRRRRSSSPTTRMHHRWTSLFLLTVVILLAQAATTTAAFFVSSSSSSSKAAVHRRQHRSTWDALPISIHCPARQSRSPRILIIPLPSTPTQSSNPHHLREVSCTTTSPHCPHPSTRRRRQERQHHGHDVRTPASSSPPNPSIRFVSHPHPPTPFPTASQPWAASSKKSSPRSFPRSRAGPPKPSPRRSKANSDGSTLPSSSPRPSPTPSTPPGPPASFWSSTSPRPRPATRSDTRPFAEH